MILAVAERLGGADRLLAWVQASEANERLFWSSIYLRVLAARALCS